METNKELSYCVAWTIGELYELYSKDGGSLLDIRELPESYVENASRHVAGPYYKYMINVCKDKYELSVNTTCGFSIKIAEVNRELELVTLVDILASNIECYERFCATRPHFYDDYDEES